MVQAILLVLIALVFIVGIGVLFVSRRAGRARRSAPSAPSAPSAQPEPRGRTGTAVITPPESVEGALAEPDLVEPQIIEPELTEAELVEEGLVEYDDAEVVEAEPEALPREGVEEEAAPVYERPRLRDRLAKARAALAGAFGSIHGRATITQDTWDELEEALLLADVGFGLTTELLDDLRAQAKNEGIKDPESLLNTLKTQISARLAPVDRSLKLDLQNGSPDVWLFVGVNGVGKTTTIGKVGARLKSEGHSIVMAAGDTFRAAATEQLETWAERAHADHFVRGTEGGDPSSVIFDAVQAAAARDLDIVLADTAGRLHTKSNLMEELSKVRRVADRPPGHVTEVLLVIDATTGQNGLQQARQFGEAVEITGVVLTKLDGSAKGGIVLAIQRELGVPVKLVGLGETIGDLVEFDPVEFVDALFAA